MINHPVLLTSKSTLCNAVFLLCAQDVASFAAQKMKATSVTPVLSMPFVRTLCGYRELR